MLFINDLLIVFKSQSTKNEWIHKPPTATFCTFVQATHDSSRKAKGFGLCSTLIRSHINNADIKRLMCNQGA